MTFVLTRDQLYDLVWSEPMQRLSKQIGISDVAIAKHCRKVGVPVPERGYWNKLQAGKPVVKARLTERDLVTINRIEMSGNLTPKLRGRFKGEPGKDLEEADTFDVRTERLRKRLGAVTVPRNFSRVHPAIATLLKKDEILRQKTVNSPYSFSWDQPKFDTPFERRRLLFLNGLFLGFEKVGGRAWLRGPTAREHAIDMANFTVHFTLEKAGHGRNGRGRGSSSASEAAETMFLSVCEHGVPPPGVTVRWQDQKGNLLEKQLAEVIVGMAVAAEHMRRQWREQQAKWERERREQEEREARRRKEEAEKRERERLVAIEREKVDALIRDAENWRRAGVIRSYVEARRAASPEDAEIEAWAAWALSEAGKLDPMTHPERTARTPTDMEKIGVAEARDEII
jgi:hypothetical protein